MNQHPVAAATAEDLASVEVLEQLTDVARQQGGLDPLVMRLMEIRAWLEEDLKALDASCGMLISGTAPLGPEHRDGDTPARQAARVRGRGSGRRKPGVRLFD